MAENHVTMRDVAAVAGVSVSTVSRALKGVGRISDDTRQRIMDAAIRLDFHPNALAQSFATGRSLTVGVLTQQASGTFATPVITGIMHTFSDHDIAVIVYDDKSDPASRPGNLRKLRARRVDGVMVVGDGTDHSFPSISAEVNAPTVYAFAVSDRPADTMLLPDDRAAGRMAAEHLLSQGRRRLAHVTAEAPSRAVREREAGFSEVLAASGLKPAIPILHGDWSRDWGLQAGEDVDLGAIDAIFCGNDFIALGLARSLIRRGARIPEDVALVGYDNWARFGLPDDFLTTIDPQLDRLGRLAAQRLVEATAGQREPGIETTDVVLVPGVSSGAKKAGEETYYPA
ncbi:MAG TPA: LacI family DNA-binding transcriptional regulator [Microlunatus sp.]